ncbi:MAG: DUF4252 domain-containing protein [Terriglobales bacterium]
MRRLLWAVLMFAVTIPCAAQVIKAPESWDKLAAKADEVVKVDLDKKMLQFASRFMDSEDDQEGKRLVEKLNAIYVRSLEFKQPGGFTDADVEPVRAQLQGPEWSRIVQVDSRTDKEKVDVYVKSVNNQTMGLVILAQEPNELTLVTLDGPLNPEDLDHLSGNFGIPKGLKVRGKKATQSAPANSVQK